MGQRNKQIPSYSRIFFLWGYGMDRQTHRLPLGLELPPLPGLGSLPVILVSEGRD